MKIRELENIAKELPCFSFQQLSILDQKLLRLNLSLWHEKKYIDRISKWRYTLSSFEKSEKSLYYISNKIYKPSYVSMESALRYYNLIPEWVFMTTACTTKKTQTLSWDRWTFFYYHIKPELMRWYSIIKYKNIPFYLANIEKTICDFIYLKPKMSKSDIEELRIDFNLLKTLTTKEKLLACSKRFNSKKVDSTIHYFISYL